MIELNLLIQVYSDAWLLISLEYQKLSARHRLMRGQFGTAALVFSFYLFEITNTESWAYNPIIMLVVSGNAHIRRPGVYIPKVHIEYQFRP